MLAGRFGTGCRGKQLKAVIRCLQRQCKPDFLFNTQVDFCYSQKSQLLVKLDWCIRKLVNESILLNKKGVEEGLKEEGLYIVIVSNQTILKLIGLLRTFII